MQNDAARAWESTVGVDILPGLKDGDSSCEKRMPALADVDRRVHVAQVMRLKCASLGCILDLSELREHAARHAISRFNNGAPVAGAWDDPAVSTARVGLVREHSVFSDAGMHRTFRGIPAL